MRSRLAPLIGALLAIVAFATSAKADPSEYGIKAASASASSNQAGDHPDFTVAFELNKEAGSGELPATTRDISIELPPGLLANPSAFPKCTAAQLVATDVNDPTNKTGCPQASQVGITEIQLFNNGSFLPFTEPIYNMASPGGDTVARLGFIAEVYPVFVEAHLRSDGDYGVTATVKGAGSLVPLLSASTTLWSVPADESHDTQRITPYEAFKCSGTPCTAPGGVSRPSGLVPTPFTLNPTRCGVAREVKFIATSYAMPEQPAEATASLPPVTGCGQLGFKPKLTMTPTNREAASPTGLYSDLTLPQDEALKSLATSELRDATVTLPKGVVIAPGAADGLEACSAQQVGLGTQGSSACPEASKIATAEIESPPLERTIEGAVYQRTPVKGDLFGIWLTSDELGVHLKLPGEVHADPVTGQLTAIFEGTQPAEGLPQVPLSDLRLHFFGGPRAPLATPSGCGTYQTHYEFTPWSGNAPVVGDTPMTIDEGCATGGFSPKLSAGSTNPVAGAFSDFVTTLTRGSGEQNISRVDVSLPPGVSAKLAGVPLCAGQAVETGECPAASQVASATVATGPGSSPLWLPQPGRAPILVFLSGPYKGAPYSIVIRTPAQAGPFDLGTVITRAAIYIDPETARATVSSDPLPQILEGVPISYRTIQVDVNHPEFALNPTSCKEMAITARITSDQEQIASPSTRFQLDGCRELPFKPKLQLRLQGKTNRGAHPTLKAVLKSRPGDANIARAIVSLPPSEFLENAHIKTICTRVQFAADQCPPGSIYGHAKVITPLLDRPLEGSVYLRSSSHTLPDLVFALNGQVEIDAVGRIDSVKGGFRTSFEAVPDAPLTKVVLTMQGGKKGLLVNSSNLCKKAWRAQVQLVGHNGKSAHQNPLLRNDCAKSARR